MAKNTNARKVSLSPKLIPRGGVTKNPKQSYKCGGKIKKAK
jgi:hypothetical protein